MVGMEQGPRLSERTVRILEVFVDQPDVWHFGLELAEAVGLKQGTIYPNLARLETLGGSSGAGRTPSRRPPRVVGREPASG
jgi:hypothetical protein